MHRSGSGSVVVEVVVSCVCGCVSSRRECMNGCAGGGRRLTAHAAAADDLQAVADPDRRRDEDAEQPGGSQAGAVRLLRRDPAGGEEGVATPDVGVGWLPVGAVAHPEVQELRRRRERGRGLRVPGGPPAREIPAEEELR